MDQKNGEHLIDCPAAIGAARPHVALRCLPESKSASKERVQWKFGNHCLVSIRNSHVSMDSGGLALSGRCHQGSRRRHLDRQLHALRSRLYRSGAENFAAPRQPVRPEVVTHVLGTFRYPCLRAGHPGWTAWWWRRESNCNPTFSRRISLRYADARRNQAFLAAAGLRGRPPFSPLRRAAAAFAVDVEAPARAARWRSI